MVGLVVVIPVVYSIWPYDSLLKIQISDQKCDILRYTMYLSLGAGVSHVRSCSYARNCCVQLCYSMLPRLRAVKLILMSLHV